MTVFRAPTDFVPIWKARAAELELSYEQIDMLSGMPDGYFGKVICGMKNPGTKAIEFYNGTLALKFVPTQDDEQAERMRGRWTKRKRPLQKPASLICVKREETSLKTGQTEVFARMQILGRMGGMASGKKRRAKAMRKRELQSKRTHAARMRWSKQVAK